MGRYGNSYNDDDTYEEFAPLEDVPMEDVPMEDIEHDTKKPKIKKQRVARVKKCRLCGEIVADETKHVAVYRMVKKEIGVVNLTIDRMKPLVKYEKEYVKCDIQKLFGKPSGKKKDGVPLWKPEVKQYVAVKLDEFAK